jgi:hypothetical protein
MAYVIGVIGVMWMDAFQLVFRGSMHLNGVSWIYANGGSWMYANGGS